MTSDIDREDIRVTTRDGHPALEVGDAEIIFRTHFQGEPAESVDVDHYDRAPFLILDFERLYSTDQLEIAPEFVPAEGGDGDE